MVYFDNASTTFPKPDCVYSTMDSVYRTQGMNAGRGQYKAAAAADKIVRETRNQVKELFGCNANYETVFTSTATEAINVIIQGIDYAKIKRVYITPFEHNAVLRTLYFLQNSLKFDIIELATIPEPLDYDLGQIKTQFTENPPDLVIMTHASNVCGLIAPIDEVAALAKKNNALTVVDMAQTAGLLNMKLNATGIDAIVFAGHKTLYGPFGASGFILRKGVSIKPLIYGGVGRDSAQSIMPDEAPDRYEAGTRNIQAIAGLGESIKWITTTGIETIFNKELCLKDELLACLAQYKNISLVGNNNGIGIVSCVFNGYDPDDIGNIFDKFDIATRTGLHCAPRAHKYLKTLPLGTIRFSLGYFNCSDDINRLNDALRYIKLNG